MKPYKVYFKTPSYTEWFQVAQFGTMEEAIAYKAENDGDGYQYEIRHE